MKKTLLSIGSVFALLLVIGAGCPNTPEQANNDDAMKTKDVMKDDTTKKDGDAMKEKTVTDFRLRAEAGGNRTVRFEWDVPETLAKDAEGFRFSRGTEENPTYPSSWWWERGPAHRALDWEGLPTGPAHFRVCVVKNDVCDTYSNNIEVDVK